MSHATHQQHHQQQQYVDYVVIIGIDGMGGYYIDKKVREEPCNDNKDGSGSSEGTTTALHSLCPTFDSLLKGSLEGFNTVLGTTNARTVFPPISSPAWGSILSGLTPDQTGMMNNDWPNPNEEDQPLPTAASAFNKTIPRTLFDLVPNAKRTNANNNNNHHTIGTTVGTAITTKHYTAVSWSWLGRKIFSHLPNVHTVQCDGDDERVVTEFVSLFGKDVTTDGSHDATALPRVSFIHFDDVDHAGHDHAWGSDAYYNSWRAADQKLARVLEVLRDKSVAIVVISDHGGSEKGHGDMKQSHMQIPIILATTASCPAVVPTAAALTATTNTPSPATLISCIDIVPTLLALQGIPKDEHLRGKVLAEYKK